jgi:glycosyltransferase involved in cell wall biosynthesis/SAM-dependent methyltransferase
MFENQYYNQSQLWNQNPEDYQIQLLADILSMIPEDTNSILDVGCGNGIITNNLPENIYVVGIDSSEEALRSVIRDKQVGSILKLPFPDNSFDMVMANDVIEHLPETIYQTGVAELFRVASKYVLISVPHAEQLEKSFTKCSDCGCVYHINHHQRSFYEKDLLGLCSTDWKINEIRYSGDVTRPPSDPIPSSWLKELQLYVTYNNSICPNCGSSNIVNNSNNRTQQILGNLRSKTFFSEKSLANKHINRSEIIAFYINKKVNYTKNVENNNLEEKLFSPLLLNLDNPLQAVKNGFVEGYFWTKYLDKNKLTEGYLSQENKNFQSILIHFPVIPEVGDKILLKTRFGTPSTTKINLIVHDDLNNISFPITNVSYIGNGEYEFLVEQAWEINSYGAAVSVEFDTLIGITYVQYLSKYYSHISEISFLYLQVGHNIISNFNLEYIRSWGLKINSSAYYPKPEWLWSKQLDSFFNFDFPKITLLEYSVLVGKIIQRKEKDINNLLNRVEEISQKKNLEFDQVNQEIAYLSSLIEKKELERSQAEESYAESSKFATFFFRNAQRRISRVLVISHLFPNQYQSNSGCFVAEQVKALREYEGLDVRVVSCQPFWCNTKNPLKLLRTVDKYREAINSSQWTLYEGIPTLFIPYLVGKPFFPFHIHGFTYRYSIAKLSNWIRKDFNFDLVHAHTGYLDGFSGMYLSKSYQVPLMITEHTGPFSYLTSKQIVRQITVKSLSFANRTICVSSALANQVKKWLPSSYHNKLLCIPNGVDTEKFYPNQVSNNCENKNLFKLLSVISLDDNKNPFLLLKAVEILFKWQIKVELTIVGGGELLKEVKEWVAEHQLQHCIHILGWQTRDEVARLMREQCDIFVMPSRSETFGVVIIEAMASGKPVVSTRCGGPDDIITQPYLGELCNNDDVMSLANGIAKVANNMENYPENQIRNFAVENYDFRIIAQKLTAIYENI